MALFILNPGVSPLGQFDVLDTDVASILGGEIMVLNRVARADTSTERSAYDVKDGYIASDIDTNSPTAYRVVALLADDAAAPSANKGFYLSDDGTNFYGVMFGTVIGSPLGQSTTGTSLGPTTMAGSGKITLWDKPGLYAVSLTAVDAHLVTTTAGTVPTHNLYDTPLPGELLYRGSTGKISRLTGANETIGSGNDKVGRFVELSSNGSMVTTPARLVGAAQVFDRIKFYFLGDIGA